MLPALALFLLSTPLPPWAHEAIAFGQSEDFSPAALEERASLGKDVAGPVVRVLPPFTRVALLAHGAKLKPGPLEAEALVLASAPVVVVTVDPLKTGSEVDSVRRSVAIGLDGKPVEASKVETVPFEWNQPGEGRTTGSGLRLEFPGTGLCEYMGVRVLLASGREAYLQIGGRLRRRLGASCN